MGDLSLVENVIVLFWRLLTCTYNRLQNKNEAVSNWSVLYQRFYKTSYTYILRYSCIHAEPISCLLIFSLMMKYVKDLRSFPTGPRTPSCMWRASWLVAWILSRSVQLLLVDYLFSLWWDCVIGAGAGKFAFWEQPLCPFRREAVLYSEAR